MSVFGKSSAFVRYDLHRLNVVNVHLWPDERLLARSKCPFIRTKCPHMGKQMSFYA